MQSSLRKAAVLLMSLPQEEAAAIMGKFTPKEVEMVSIEIAKLGSVNSFEQDETINEFANSSAGSIVGSGGMDLAKSLVEKALGKNAGSTIDNLRHSIEAVPFGFLKNVDSQNLLTFIIDEHPQTIALILSHLTKNQAADIVSGLPSERQLAVVRRIATMGQTNPEIIGEVERGLENRIQGLMSQSFEKAGGVQTVAEILNVIDRATERGLLENLAQENPDLVEEIRRLMFVFEDINKFSDKDIQLVLKNVETNQWALALKGCSESLRLKVFGNLSTRAADSLREEMEYLGPVKLSAVEQTQQQIVDIIRRLQDSGELVINNNQEEEEMIT